ncbi:hypothetical protein BDP55DRAFT_716362 [Colletotrichum godetiae]|uniref:Uncharacterized protein n=1 Tax=Colletotrichum godetiae TaxID=1209918 RepID=A0AAJ0EUP4_9PEZI|nr:uncharacterized protein BDP55DRAFT_716362 [Colletotrichum godetiae]KAK1674558.1 hypothetical protein BDP55DRAFT_716362 [Colletotrichum godetiae]
MTADRILGLFFAADLIPEAVLNWQSSGVASGHLKLNRQVRPVPEFDARSPPVCLDLIPASQPMDCSMFGCQSVKYGLSGHTNMDAIATGRDSKGRQKIFKIIGEEGGDRRRTGKGGQGQCQTPEPDGDAHQQSLHRTQKTPCLHPPSPLSIRFLIPSHLSSPGA